MNKGSGSGGGQSSLGYLFGPDAEKQKKEAELPPPPPSPTTTRAPPYGIDIDTTGEKSPETSSEYIRVQGNNSGNSITGQGRPSTRVKSVPGGDSSLGYLFGDK